MDSANSGSLQSSSGGDEEYDSRAESISAFFNSTTTGGAASLPNLQPPPQPPPSSHHHPPPHFFDTLSYLDSNPNPLLNLDMAWARGLRQSPSSNPSCTDIAGLIATSSSTSLMAAAPLARPYSGGIGISQPTVQQPAPAPDQPTLTTAAARSSKKRSRASRRAPTTVLTTDTSNFRAMVQEFTGIPAPPFASSSSPFPRSRFDLFHSSTLRSSAMAADPPPPYLLRPFAQKVQAPSFASAPSSSTANITTTSNANANTSIQITTPTSTNPTATNNYQLPSSDLGLANQHQTLLDIHNPILSFQSLLQSPLTQKYSLPTMPTFATAKSQPPMIPSHQANYGTGGDLGIPSLITSEGMHSRGRGDELSDWGHGSRPAEGSGDQAQLRPVIGNYGNSQRTSSCKLNYSAPASSDFHAEKGSDSVPARGEGMVDSWICSSD